MLMNAHSSFMVVSFPESDDVWHFERNTGYLQPGILAPPVTEEPSEEGYEEKTEADNGDDDPGTEALVTMTQPSVLPQAGQTLA